VVVQILEVPREGSVLAGGLGKAGGAAQPSPACRNSPSPALMGFEGCTEHGAWGQELAGLPPLCRSCWEPPDFSLTPQVPVRSWAMVGGSGELHCSNGWSLCAGHQRLAGVGHLICHPGSARETEEPETRVGLLLFPSGGKTAPGLFGDQFTCAGLCHRAAQPLLSLPGRGTTQA